MFCQKCGEKNADSAAFCGKCGASLQPSTQPTAANNDKNSSYLKKLSSAHILNIVAAVIMILCFALCLYLFNQDVFTSSSTSGNTTTTSSLSVGNFPAPLYIDCLVSAILFVIGLSIYKSGDIAKKKKLSVAYLIISIPLCAFSLVASFLNSLATCGLSFLLLASSIMQIIVGAKFFIATKHHG